MCVNRNSGLTKNKQVYTTQILHNGRVMKTKELCQQSIAIVLNSQLRYNKYVSYFLKCSQIPMGMEHVAYMILMQECNKSKHLEKIDEQRSQITFHKT